MGAQRLQTATLAGGCFWCTEAIFKRLKGVERVTSGYSGGFVDHPSYEQVSTGETGHAEAVQIEFDPTIISYEQLLDVFFHLHDPTTLNRQGADVGPQYRSAIFYHDEEQRKIAEKFRERMEESRVYRDPLVTEIVLFEHFYPAETYHENYYEKHKLNSYCRIVIDPKITKLYREYKDVIKEEYQKQKS